MTTKEQVIELAKQAGFDLMAENQKLVKLAKLVRNAALDEAAQKCRTPHSYFKDSRTNIECALAIESLKEPTL